MALIVCPECGRRISDRASFCPNCGLPAAYFDAAKRTDKTKQDERANVDGQNTIKPVRPNLSNLLISFDRDYMTMFSPSHYIAGSDIAKLRKTYGEAYATYKKREKYNEVVENIGRYHVDIESMKSFLQKMYDLNDDAKAHNKAYVQQELVNQQEYFDTILKEIDPDIMLDDEQREAVVTDDDYCLLVAGAGAGKTTTMAAKVRYLVDKKHVNPEEIIVISYTNKAIGELQDRINRGLNIPAKICTFHKFAFDIVKKFSAEPPEVNFSSYKIISEILEKTIFEDKQLMRNLVLFMGYYFDLTEDVFQFENLNQYHLYKASMVYETLKSGLGEYINKVSDQRRKRMLTITGEYLRSVQEVQIANFLYLNGIDYEYEKVYPYGTPLSSGKKYTPDFFISQGEHTAWIEHYALSDTGYNNRFTPQETGKYKKAIRDKRIIHQKSHTTLLETWSMYSDRRSLLEHLEETLVKEGFVLKPRNLDEVYKKLVETGKDKYIYKLIFFMMNFIEHIRRRVMMNRALRS